MKYVLLLPVLFSSGCLLLTGILSKDCNDGFVDEQEECDDSNNRFGDGCDATCLQEEVVVTMDDINEANIDNARFAIFSTRTAPVDVTDPPDGVIDADLEVLTLVISDKEDLCAQLAADPQALANLPELEAIQVQALRRAPVGESGFLDGESITSNTSILGAAFGLELDSIFVGATIFLRVGGDDLILANNPVFESNDGVFAVDSITADKLSAQLSLTLTAERVAEPFDLDEDPFDDDATPTVRTIDAPLVLSVRNISLCSAL